MIKFVCVFALLAASGLAFPVEENPKLSRPSPINPEVASDPKPTALKEAVPASSTTESHIQKVPASGVKLSVEVAKKEETTTSSSSTPELPTKNNAKRSVDADGDVSTTTKQPAFRRNQPTTTTEEPSSTTPSSTTSSPVSVKTPIGTTRSKREVEVTAVPASSTSAGTTKRTTTVAPSHTNEEEGPHYVRPVPVDQILKNLNQPEKPSSSGASEHHKSVKPEDDKDSDESSEEVPPKEAATEQKTHQQTHPVIHQQGA
ncbi:uncharacterized protein LOC128715235 [Anopheles marshallii]|uniref:uncharacterized protein LOC128715235 n=1 Tax=Anopheles marshallii TaxID=1521116 RepID=UPI00237B53C0|nr:uncharacterized protein LOC128715235 [Anopheles marshallii]